MQAEVTIFDTSPTRIRELNILGGRARAIVSDPGTLAHELANADVIIGAVLVPGKATPEAVRREHLSPCCPLGFAHRCGH
jgi:alanine dehydrogenase